MVEQLVFYSNKLRSGAILLYPTDTIWGLGCDASNKNAVARIYDIKKRDPDKPFILLVESIERLKKHVVEVHPRIETLLNYYNKPITIIYKANDSLHPSLLSKDGTVAIRVVKNKFCQNLISGLNRPIISTSANIQGQSFPSTFHEISEEIKKEVDVIVDVKYEETSKPSPSIMIKMTDEGELEFIRS